MPKLTKLQYFVLLILLSLIGSVSFNVNIYIEKKLSAKYQEGIAVGQAQINNTIISQLQTNGFLKVKLNEGQFLLLQPYATTTN